MDRYYCTFKMPDQLIPSSVSFESEHPGTAIIKLMSLANVTTTMAFEEAEILKVIRTESGKPGYVSVFLKEKDDKKGRIVPAGRQRPAPVIDKAVIEQNVDVYKLPYTIEVL